MPHHPWRRNRGGVSCIPLGVLEQCPFAVNQPLLAASAPPFARRNCGWNRLSNDVDTILEGDQVTRTRQASRAIGALAVGIAAAFLACEARCAESIPKIGFLGFDSATQAPRMAAFREGLRALGYVEGKDVVIDERWAEGRFEHLPKLASELVADKVNVILTAAPPAIQAARNATTTIPIVMLTDDPVTRGLAQSFARPGRNITGVAFQGAELTTKALSVLRDAVPGLQQVAILYYGESGAIGVAAAESAAKTLRMQTRAFEVRDIADLPAAIKEAKSWGAQGLMEISAPILTMNRKVLIAELAANRMPAICGLPDYVVDGCLMTYSADLNGMFRQMASFVDRILKGANPATLPIEQSREFVFLINKKTADSLGLRISKSLQSQMTAPFL